jgi:hypothetical protein
MLTSQLGSRADIEKVVHKLWIEYHKEEAAREKASADHASPSKVNSIPERSNVSTNTFGSTAKSM